MVTLRVGDADAAFRLHSEMVREGCPLDKHSATSLVDACSQELLRTSASQRRQRLVLLERAGISGSYQINPCPLLYSIQHLIILPLVHNFNSLYRYSQPTLRPVP
jgi:pentatricopeptide repeat protein